MIHADSGDMELAAARFAAGDNPRAEDNKLIVRFSVRPVQDAEATSREGRPIFKDTEFVEIMVPGDKTNILEHAVTDDDRQRFPRAYARHKAGLGDVLEGTMLTAWPLITRARAEELAYFKVRTVEQLAELSDGNSMNMGPGINELRKAAKDFVAQAKGDAPLLKMRAELEKRDGEIAALQQALKEQGAMLAKLGAPGAAEAMAIERTPKRRGRPPKAPPAEV